MGVGCNPSPCLCLGQRCFDPLSDAAMPIQRNRVFLGCLAVLVITVILMYLTAEEGGYSTHSSVTEETVAGFDAHGLVMDSNSSFVTTVVGGTLGDGVQELVQRCIAATHLDSVLDSGFSLGQARSNAAYMFGEFRKLIPEKPLENYKSHCWEESLSVQWMDHQCIGHVGNISFEKLSKRRIHPARKYESKLVCLPNVFLAGFPKCGSTFLYCFINRLISLDTNMVKMNEEKEPHFWALANAARKKFLPLVSDIGGYLLNFIPGLKQIQSLRRPEGILVDSSPNTMFNWPRFRSTEHDLTNYCILPAVLPVLLPNSKFVVIMRNPVNMLYSAFWFSCTTRGWKFSNTTLLKGPDLFHERVMSKINLFNKCMQDTSVPSISHVCDLTSSDYNSCIRKRLHLLEKCSYRITFNLFSDELNRCGRSRVAMGLYYVHVNKWLSVVPRERFLFLTLEGIVQHPIETAHRIKDFLDLKIDMDTRLVNSIMKSCRQNTQSKVDYRHNPQLHMRNDTKAILEHFYYPFNSLLADVTGADFNSWFL